jgi:hypothetical protein
VAEYDDDPEAFADKYYPRQGVHSYPVQTRISRERENLDYYSGRFEDKIEDVVQAESSLALLEQDVLVRVLAMRPTPGRVPWPRKLRQLHLDQFEAQVRRELDEYQVRRVQHLKWVQGEYEQELAQAPCGEDAQDEQMLIERQARWATMTPEEIEREQEAKSPYPSGFEEGRFTIQDIIAALKGITRRRGTGLGGCPLAVVGLVSELPSAPVNHGRHPQRPACCLSSC